MKTIIFYILIINFCISFFSCKKEELNEINDTEYVMHCLFTEGEAPKIKISKTLETFPEYPFDAIYYDQPNMFGEYPEIKLQIKTGVTIYDDFEEITIHDIPNRLNISYANYNLTYFTNKEVIAKVGQKYDLEVNIYDWQGNFIKTLTANTTIPEKVPTELNQEEDFYNEYSDTLAVYKLAFDDPSEQQNFYYLLSYSIEIPADKNINTINMDSLWLWRADDYSDIEIEIPNYSRSHFSELNLENYNPQENHFIGILFDDKSFNGEKKTFTLRTYTPPVFYENKGKKYFFVELFHITEEYYKYYKAIEKQANTQLDIYSEPVELYTNVQNGLGLFAGVTKSKHMVEVKRKNE